MAKRKTTKVKRKLVTVTTPLGYLTTTPQIAAKVIAAGKKRAKKK